METDTHLYINLFKDMKTFQDILADIKKSQEGADVAQIDKAIQDYKPKVLTNDTENTTAVGFGKEFIPVDTLTQSVVTVMRNEASFMNALPGFHGYGMGISEKLPIRGKLPRAKSNSEWTTWANLIGAGGKRISTATVTINQKSLIVQVDISDRYVNYAIDDLLDYTIGEIGKSQIADIEYLVLNGDTEAGATGNINSADALPSSTLENGADDILLNLDGLRKYCISNSYTTDVGTLTWSDFIFTRKQLGKFSSKLSDLLLLMDAEAYHKALTLDEFKKANENGRSSTIYTGAISNIAGVDMFVPETYPSTYDDGKIYTTDHTNTKGWFMYLEKAAVQYGFGKPLETEMYRVLGKGYSIIGVYEFGFAIVNKKAWETDGRVRAWINVSPLTA